MTNSALIMMLSAEIFISSAMIYFFVRVLTTPPKQENDSYSGNDDIPASQRQKE